jgi:hypothetical protein
MCRAAPVGVIGLNPGGEATAGIAGWTFFAGSYRELYDAGKNIGWAGLRHHTR